jgi:NADPH2:quinone reductase
MKAIRVHQPGGPDALIYEDVPEPTPGPGEALVKLAAIGINFIDIYRRKGLYPSETPFILGEEAAGEVVALGEGVTEVQVGDRVAYSSVRGAYAEYAAVPAKSLVPLPAGLDARVAAASMLQGLTAHYLTHSTYPIQPGDRHCLDRRQGRIGPCGRRR